MTIGGSELPSFLLSNRAMGRYPMHRIKSVDKPTILLTDNIRRVDARENAFSRARRGDYGPAVQKEAPHADAKYPLSVSLADIRRSIAQTKPNDVAAHQAPIPDDPGILTRHIKRLGYFLRADIMSVCRVPDYAVYSHDMQGNQIEIKYQSAIVIVLAKEFETLVASNGSDWINTPLSYDDYLRLALISETMANYIRRLGFAASAEYTGKMPGSSAVLFAPLILWSGIGEISRAGILLNPFLGMGFKAAVVLTNMPLEADRPIDFGLQDFCRLCRKCAKECPSSAIPEGDKVMHNGYMTWKLNEQRCHSFRVLNKKGTYCGRCIKVCPWTKPNTWPHNMVRRLAQGSGVSRRVVVSADRLTGRKERGQRDKWWFDLEEVDGSLRIPGK
jgi:3-chloro-4-hydroxyphenylacetate reductive dehalogenase